MMPSESPLPLDCGIHVGRDYMARLMMEEPYVVAITRVYPTLGFFRNFRSAKMAVLIASFVDAMGVITDKQLEQLGFEERRRYALADNGGTVN